MQNLLRGLLPDSFPARLATEPSTEKQRRFIIIDEAVHAIYGPQLEKVHTHNSQTICYLCHVFVGVGSHTQLPIGAGAGLVSPLLMSGVLWLCVFGLSVGSGPSIHSSAPCCVVEVSVPLCMKLACASTWVMAALVWLASNSGMVFPSSLDMHYVAMHVPRLFLTHLLLWIPVGWFQRAILVPRLTADRKELIIRLIPR